MPDISVLTVTHNRRALLYEKLRSLRAQTLTPERFELIVVVNASSDGTAAMLRETSWPFALKTVLSDANLGAARGRNVAAHEAEGATLLVSDDDCALTERVLERHLKAHQAYPGSVVVGPTRLAESYRRGKQQEPFEGQRNLAGRALWIHATGTNTSFPRSAFREVGGYDERFSGYGGEDPALALALRARGLRFRFAKDALVYHLGRQLTGDFEARARSAGRAQWRLYQEHPSLEVGLMLGVHPLLLGLKRLLFGELVARLVAHPRYRFERAYYQGAVEESYVQQRL